MSIGAGTARAARDPLLHAAHAASARALQLYSDAEPILLPETVPWVATPRGGEYVFAVVVDTRGHIELATVQTLLAFDSVGAQAIRQQFGRVRYIPGRLIEVNSPCIRINGTLRHCGGDVLTVKKLRQRVLLRLELEPQK
jgi:hypothetical protein